MLKRLTILAVTASGVFFAFAAAASAEARTAEVPAAEQVGSTAADPFTSPSGLVVRSSHGYWLTIDAAKGHRVQLEAEGADGSVTYSVPGTDSAAGIHAKLGKYGRIDMRWVPSGRVREVRLQCHYRGVKKHYYDTGSYVGTLRFEGGGGFTSATVHRVAWHRSWYSPSVYSCGYSLSTGEPGAGVVINAGERGHMSTPVHFSAYRAHKGAKVEYSARSEETEGPVKITRHAYAERGSDSLTLTAANGKPTATVRPPAPFYGAATFEGAPTLEHTNGSKGTLTGELGVEFPDATKARLAGEGFEAELREESISITPG
jgi:hypothetical protein